eukprot:845822-Amphidinium_carterae.1
MCAKFLLVLPLACHGLERGGQPAVFTACALEVVLRVDLFGLQPLLVAIHLYKVCVLLTAHNLLHGVQQA